MSDATRVLRRTLPTRQSQLAYHAALEAYFAERGRSMRIVRFMSKWEIRWQK